MDVITILVLLVLNIALPTLDTFTDINLVIKLYRGAQYCDRSDDYLRVRDDYEKCQKDPVGYCSNDENNQGFCRLWQGVHYCSWRITPAIAIARNDYKKCQDDPVSYCSNDENNQVVCRFSNPHYKMATAMLIPFLLNYIVCFITFLRKEKNKKFTFIFALLNHYPQFGKNNH